jgi:hypothetical protein
MFPPPCPRWLPSLSARLMANAMQFRLSPVLWLFIDMRAFFLREREGAHEDHSRRQPDAGFNDFILRMPGRGPRIHAKVPIFAVVGGYPLPRSPEVEYSRGPRFYIWLLSEYNMKLLGFPCPATRDDIHLEVSRPRYSSIVQCSSYCGCMGCVKWWTWALC